MIFSPSSSSSSAPAPSPSPSSSSSSSSGLFAPRLKHTQSVEGFPLLRTTTQPPSKRASQGDPRPLQRHISVDEMPLPASGSNNFNSMPFRFPSASPLQRNKISSRDIDQLIQQVSMPRTQSSHNLKEGAAVVFDFEDTLKASKFFPHASPVRHTSKEFYKDKDTLFSPVSYRQSSVTISPVDTPNYTSLASPATPPSLSRPLNNRVVEVQDEHEQTQEEQKYKQESLKPPSLFPQSSYHFTPISSLYSDPTLHQDGDASILLGTNSPEIKPQSNAYQHTNDSPPFMPAISQAVPISIPASKDASSSYSMEEVVTVPILPASMIQDFEVIRKAVDNSTCDTWLVRSRLTGKMAVFKPRDGEAYTEQREQQEEREREERRRRADAIMGRKLLGSASANDAAPSTSCPLPVSHMRTPVKRGVHYGDTTRKEVAAYIMDHHHFAGVPKTMEATIWLKREDAPVPYLTGEQQQLLTGSSQLQLTDGQDNSAAPSNQLLLRANSPTPPLPEWPEKEGEDDCEATDCNQRPVANQLESPSNQTAPIMTAAQFLASPSLPLPLPPGTSSASNTSFSSSPPEDVVATYGSLQDFVENEFSAEDMGSSQFSTEEVHRIGTLDIRLLNLDRHLGNLLVQRDERGKPHLIPIDHGYILPSYHDLSDVHLEWTYWRQCQEPFSEEIKKYVNSLNPLEDAERLKTLGIRDDALISMVFSSYLLREAVNDGYNLYHIANMVQRDGAGDQPSVLEKIVSRVIAAVGEEQENNFFSESGYTSSQQNSRPESPTIAVPLKSVEEEKNSGSDSSNSSSPILHERHNEKERQSSAAIPVRQPQKVDEQKEKSSLHDESPQFVPSSVPSTGSSIPSVSTTPSLRPVHVDDSISLLLDAAAVKNDRLKRLHTLTTRVIREETEKFRATHGIVLPKKEHDGRKSGNNSANSSATSSPVHSSRSVPMVRSRSSNLSEYRTDNFYPNGRSMITHSLSRDSNLNQLNSNILQDINSSFNKTLNVTDLTATNADQSAFNPITHMSPSRSSIELSTSA